MTNEKCQRCNWPYAKNSDAGCTPGNCSCQCAQYPVCPCGTFDKEKPEAAISVPKGTVVAKVEPIVQAAIIDRPYPDPHLVVLHQPSGGRAKVIYIGNDKGKAFDAIMGMAEDALLSEITVETEKS